MGYSILKLAIGILTFDVAIFDMSHTSTPFSHFFLIKIIRLCWTNFQEIKYYFPQNVSQIQY